MAINDEIREQTKKLKDMTLAEKADYIWTYYKIWIIGAVIITVVIISTTKTVLNNSKPVYLDAIFLNSNLSGSGVNCTLEEEFRDRYDIDMNAYNMSFDYVTYLDDNYGNQASMAGQVKVMSKYSEEQLDILCGQESVLLGPADMGGYYDFSMLFTEEQLEELEKKGYEPFYYTEKIYAEDAKPDANGDIPYTDGNKYIAGIYIDKCPKLVGNKSSCVYEASGEDRWVLTVAWNTGNLEHAVEFINFVTE